MKILAINCGSSTLKFKLVELSGARVDEQVSDSLAQGTIQIQDPVSSHSEAVRIMGQRLRKANVATEIAAVGHRVVHGGSDFSSPALIDAGVLKTLEQLRTLAPLHNGPALEAIRACRTLFGNQCAMVATFDTAFHTTLPEHARRYAIPEDLTVKHGLWRYGFHGLAHRWMMERYSALARRPVEEVTLITLQLGSGCSAAAIQGGRSVETSMGLTPSEGLMMATRSGDVDPSLPGLLAEREGLTLKQVEELLNEKSGLRGVDGSNREAPAIIDAARNGEPRADLAVDMFCHRVRKYVGAYLAVLGGADAIVFGGGIGENAPLLRARICAGMEWCGLQFDAERNESTREGCISTQDSELHAYVVPVNEEVLIARDTLDCLESRESNGRLELCHTQSH
jgi:acetate kinase